MALPGSRNYAIAGNGQRYLPGAEGRFLDGLFQ